jgi:hypothetical protein
MDQLVSKTWQVDFHLWWDFYNRGADFQLTLHFTKRVPDNLWGIYFLGDKPTITREIIELTHSINGYPVPRP